MAAGLERYIGDGASRPSGGGAQRHDFSVGLAGSGMPPFADDLTITHQHAAYARIRIRRVQAPFRQFQRARHPAAFRQCRIACGIRGHFRSLPGSSPGSKGS